MTILVFINCLEMQLTTDNGLLTLQIYKIFVKILELIARYLMVACFKLTYINKKQIIF